MKNPIYRIVLAPLIMCLVIIFLAYYSIGIVEKNNVLENARKHIELTTQQYENSQLQYNQLIKKLCSEYESKTKTVSVLLTQLPYSIHEDMALEEIRTAIGAEEISLSDKNGMIVCSTSPNSSPSYIDDYFRNGLTVNNYADVEVLNADQKYIFNCAVSRRDSPGMLICTFSDTSMNYNDSRFTFPENNVLSSCVTAIVDSSTMTYLHHTNSILEGSDCILDRDYFVSQKDHFSHKIYGKSSLICYSAKDGNIIMCITPKKDIFLKRNETCAWLITLSMLAIGSLLLSVRNLLLSQEKKRES